MLRAILVLSLLLVAGPVRAVDITGCGQSVPDNDVGTLTGPISCGGAFVGIIVGAHATLDLNGYSISDISPLSGAVFCGASCRVIGPGAIAAGAGNGILLTGGTLRISDVDIHNCHIGILSTSPGRVIATNMSIRNSTNYGMLAQALRGTNVTVTDNAGYGLAVGRLRVRGLVATGNEDEGVQAVRAVLRDSTVTGNDVLGDGVDITALRRLRVVNTTCGKSQVTDAPPGTTWGVARAIDGGPAPRRRGDVRERQGACARTFEPGPGRKTSREKTSASASPPAASQVALGGGLGSGAPTMPGATEKRIWSAPGRKSGASGSPRYA